MTQNLTKNRDLRILLVDDDSIDRELFIDATRAASSKCEVVEAANGEEATNALAAADKLPDLIFLDLNMPIMDGREALKIIKNTEAFKSIPVCIMTTSSAEFDVAAAYNNGANLFFVKPLDFKHFIDMLSSIFSLFSNYVTLPK